MHLYQICRADTPSHWRVYKYMYTLALTMCKHTDTKKNTHPPRRNQHEHKPWPHISRRYSLTLKGILYVYPHPYHLYTHRHQGAAGEGLHRCRNQKDGGRAQGWRVSAARKRPLLQGYVCGCVCVYVSVCMNCTGVHVYIYVCAYMYAHFVWVCG